MARRPNTKSVSRLTDRGPANKPEQRTASAVVTMNIDRRLNWNGLVWLATFTAAFVRFHVKRPIAPELPVSCETSSLKRTDGGSKYQWKPEECYPNVERDVHGRDAAKVSEAKPVEPVAASPQTSSDTDEKPQKDDGIGHTLRGLDQPEGIPIGEIAHQHEL